MTDTTTMQAAREQTAFTGDMAHDLAVIDQVIAQGPYSPDWASLSHSQPPAWFADAKFGIFTHWGMYSVPAYRNEWYSRNMYIEGYPEFDHHRETFGPQCEFGYKDFIPLFTADQFDADNWLDLFAAAGARYVVPVAEHHDGFQLYPSALSHWNAAEMGPKRDVIGELRSAAAAHGVHFATSNHRAEHWWFMGHGRDFDSDVREPMQRGDFYWPAMPEPDNYDWHSQPYPTKEYLDDWLVRVCELVDAYRPELLYFDWWIQHEAFKPYLRRFAAYYYNRAAAWGSPASICYKDDGLAWGAGIVDVERGGFADAKPYVWQTDTAIARNSWCHTDSLDYKTLPELVGTLIDTVAKNGNLLLNVGPRADGAIDPADRVLLEGIGAWLAENGEGIYGTRPWKITQEGPTRQAEGAFGDQQAWTWTSADFRFTARDGAVYAYCMNPEGAEQLTITSFAAYHDGVRPPFHGLVAGVEQLGVGPVPFERTNDGLVVTPAPRTGAATLPLGLRITIL